MNKNNEKEINNINIFVSAVIIAIAILLIGTLGSLILRNIELPKMVSYLLRPIMYVITIAFTQFVIQKVSAKSKNNK